VTIDALAVRMRDKYRVSRSAPAHCSGHLAFEAFQQVYDDRFILAGLGERIAFTSPSR